MINYPSLETLSNTFSQDVHGWVSLHNFRHSLLNKWFTAREPVAISRVKIVSHINSDEQPSGRWVDRHVISCVVQKLKKYVKYSRTFDS